MAFKPTPQQQNALLSRGSVLVSAAAGSGKTAVLSNRVLGRITDSVSPIDIGDMLIVTFTNAAAAEMRERISANLSAYLAEHPDNLRVLQQKADLDTAQIGTIDSFCIDLVRDNFESVGINADFKIASQEQLSVLESRAINEAFSDMLAASPDEFKSLVTALGADYGFDNAKAAVRKVYDYTRTLPFPESWLDSVQSLYSAADADTSVWGKLLLKTAFDTADYHYNSLSSVVEAISEDEVLSQKYLPAVSGLRDLYFRVKKAAASGKYSSVSEEITSYSPVPLSAARNVDPALKEYAKHAFDSAKKALQSLSQQFSATGEQCKDDISALGGYVSTLCKAVTRFEARLSELKQKRNLYGFDDVERAALRLLCVNNNGTAEPKDTELCTRYKEVLVDEYQDTNDLQNAIFYALSDRGKNLFLVGDVKQSIYRFRRANPANFINKKETYPEYDGTVYPSKISLSGNFRSRKGICDFVNFVFGLLMSKQAAEMDYLPEDRLEAKGTFAETDEPTTEFHIINGDTADEAAFVAQYIRNAVDSGMTVSGEDSTLRPVRYSDFLIMMRSYNKVDGLLSSLKAMSVPAWTESKAAFFSREEIVIALSLLRTIDNPLKDVPLLATLMSPVFGFTAEEMAQMRLCSKTGSLYSALCIFASTSEKASAFLKKLGRYRNWAETLTADKLISKVFDDTGLTAVVRAMDDGASRRENLLVLTEYAANYESTGFKGLTAFLRFIDSVEANGADLRSASVVNTDDVVRIMSIHKSKGLQAPVCILFDTNSTFNTKDSGASVTVDEQLGIGLRICDDERSVKYDTLPRMAISLKETACSVAEEMRLLYVALTRAQDKLVITCADKKYIDSVAEMASKLRSDWAGSTDSIDSYAVKTCRCYADWLYMACLLNSSAEPLRAIAGDDLNCLPTQSAIKVCIHDAVDLPETAHAQEVCYQNTDMSQYLDFEYVNRRLMDIESKYSVSTLAKSVFDARYCCTARPAFLANEALTPAQKGTATHRFMCFADFERAKQSVAAETERLVNEGILSKEQGAAIDENTVTAFFESDIYRRIQSADRVLKESRFIYEMPVTEIDPDCGSDETVVVQGVADCVIFESDGITILDFKTDRNCTEQQLVEKYSKQLEIYAAAFSSNYKQPAKPSYLYSFWLKKAIKLP